MKKIGVIGVGSAGVLSLCHFISMLDKSWQVYSIHDPSIPILGVGESTNPTFTNVLQKAFAFNMVEDLAPLEATHKFGTKWFNWREHSFWTPALGGDVAIQFNNLKLKDFAFKKLKDFWGDKFQTLEGRVDSLENNGISHVDVVVDGVTHKFDYIVDCRGFPKEFNEDYQVLEYMPTNHAILHSIEGGRDVDYTGHTATPNGWMFTIGLTTRTTYGYTFNDTITTLEEAKTNFSDIIGVPVDKLKLVEYKFKSFYTKKLIDGRICKNGNKAVFFEPLSATGIFMYDKINEIFYDYMIKGAGPTLAAQNYTNKDFVTKVSEGMELLISYFYHGGSIYDTPFWDHAKKGTSEIVKNSPQMARAIKNFAHWHSLGCPAATMPQFFFPSNLSAELDGPRGFNYNYLYHDRTQTIS